MTHPESSEGDNESLLKELKKNPLGISIASIGVVLAAFAVSTSKQIAAALIVLAMFSWFLLRIPRINAGGARRFILPAILSTVLLGLAAYFAYWYDSSQHPKAGNPLSIAKPTPAGTNLSFVQPDGRVPPCNTFYGSGSIPADKTLLIFDRGVPDNPESERRARYYFDGPVKIRHDGWLIREVEVGANKKEGFQAEVAAVLRDKNVASDFITAHTKEKSRQNVPLPAGNVASMVVVRNGDKGGCASS
jgi:hypothetical protein